jgi:hypothetical protein
MRGVDQNKYANDLEDCRADVASQPTQNHLHNGTTKRRSNLRLSFDIIGISFSCKVQSCLAAPVFQMP